MLRTAWRRPHGLLLPEKYFYLPASANIRGCRRIIGKGGTSIRELQDKTKTQIHMPKVSLIAERPDTDCRPRLGRCTHIYCWLFCAARLIFRECGRPRCLACVPRRVLKLRKLRNQGRGVGWPAYSATARLRTTAFKHFSFLTPPTWASLHSGMRLPVLCLMFAHALTTPLSFPGCGRRGWTAHCAYCWEEA